MGSPTSNFAASFHSKAVKWWLTHKAVSSQGTFGNSIFFPFRGCPSLSSIVSRSLSSSSFHIVQNHARITLPLPVSGMILSHLLFHFFLLECQISAPYLDLFFLWSVATNRPSAWICHFLANRTILLGVQSSSYWLSAGRVTIFPKYCIALFHMSNSEIRRKINHTKRILKQVQKFCYCTITKRSYNSIIVFWMGGGGRVTG